MNDEQDSLPAPVRDETPTTTGRRKAPARGGRRKAAATESAPNDARAVEPTPAEAPIKPARARRAPRKPKATVTEQIQADMTADLFGPVPSGGEHAQTLHSAITAVLPETVGSDEGVAAAEPLVSNAPLFEATAMPVVELEAESEGDAPEHEASTGPRRRRKRRRHQGERNEFEADAPADLPEPVVDADAPSVDESIESAETAVEPEAATAGVDAAEPLLPPPLTVVSLGLETPPALSAAALTALREARMILGTAEALDRLAVFGLEVPQVLCGAESLHLDLRRSGHAGCVLVVVGDGAGDGPALELLAEFGPGEVRLLPGVGRVQAACASLGLSAEIVTLVDLRRAPLAALRGQLRAHRLLAVPVADAAVPVAVAHLLVDSGFAAARVWVCEALADGLRSTAWLATELAELRAPIDPHAVLIIATGPSSGVFAELPGLSDAAFGDDAPAALPLAARLLALAWLQPAAWEQGWAIADGDASLALEWARAVPTGRVRAVGVEPSVLGMAMARAGVGENLAAIPAASPLRCREWPAPEAVFIRGGAGLSDWLTAAWGRLAPGGRLVVTAEDDHARAELLAFAADVPADAWQELNLARGETVAGRLRFAPAAPIRLALWRKPLN